MIRRHLFHCGLLTSFFILLISCIGSKKKSTIDENETPNIICIISDDQGWTDYGFMGHEYIRTPNIDRLASQGLTFTRGHVTAPLCRPSLASIATGLYPHQTGIIDNGPVFKALQMERHSKEWLVKEKMLNQEMIANFRDLPTLMDLLREKDYLSFQSGKWWEGHYANGGFTHGMSNGNPDNGGGHGDFGLRIGREGLDTLYRFIDLALDKGKPFFVWYAPFMPHKPHNPPDSLLEKYLSLAPTPAVASYWAMCEWFDHTIGQLIGFIQERGLSENTLFVYVCDNGWVQNPDTPEISFSRSKGTLYEMGIRTPIIFKWQGIIEPQIDTTNLVSSIDIATTLLSACEIPSTEVMQGINLLDAEHLNERSSIFSEYYAHGFNNNRTSLYYRISIITHPWKMIFTNPDYHEQEKPELYNIFKDPYELHNKADEFPEIMMNLNEHLKNWWDMSVTDQFLISIGKYEQ